MLSDKTHAVYRGLKRDSGIKNKAVAKSRSSRFVNLALASFALFSFAASGQAQNLTQSGFTGVLVPQYMASGNTTRLPVMYRATVTGLTASTSYRYYTQAALSSVIGTAASGAGNPLLAISGGYLSPSSPGLSTAGTYHTFTTDASGSYTGWFGFVNTGNAAFTSGNTVYPTIVLNAGGTGTTVSKRLALDVGILVQAFSASAGANNCSFIRSTSSATAKNLVLLYDNISGTGRPLSIVPAESIGVAIGSVITGYSTSAGAWSSSIPNSNANGVRRIEQRSLAANAIVGYSTDADGSWPTGSINTVNPVTGTTAIVIAAADAPLNTTPAAATAPAAPTINSITPGNGSLSVAFTAGSDGGSAITNYKYTTDGSTWTAAGVTTSPITISGLSNGTAYNVQIKAVNSIGDGTATASTAATPRTTAGAPTALSVTPGNGQLTALFTAPASNGGSAITNYEYSTNGGTSFTAVSPASTSTSIVITSLLNGTPYNVQVRAVNAAGSGTATASVSGTPRTTPGAPTSLALTAGNGQLTASFTAPASNGGSVITNYEYSTDGGSTFSAVSPVSTSTSIVITSLLNGTPYNVQVRAVNAAGSGTATASVSGTPRTTPGAPTSLALTAGNGQLTASFTAPASNGGSVITNYEYSTDGGSTFSAVSPVSTSTSIVITSLLNGTPYNVQVRAVNVAGSGTATASVSGTPTAPASPQVTVSGLSGTLSTTYGTPSGERSFTVSGFTLSGDLTVTAPTGLAVSTTSGSGFGDSLTLAASSQSVSNTTIYVRLKASATAGSYNNLNISITGGGDDKNVTTSSTGNTVTAKTLTITGLTFENKVYDRTTTASATGTAALSGVESGDTANVSLDGTPAYTFVSAGVGTSIAITTAGYSISGSASGNYSLTQPSGNANITVAPLTVSGASATDRAYNTLTTVAIAGGTLSGVIAGDAVTLGGSPAGTVGTAAPSDGKPVTVTGFSISGTGAGNYSLSQPTGLTVNIAKASQTILGVATTLTKTFGDAAYSLGASVASGETLSYSSDNSAVATVNSAGLVTIIGAGSANISVSQAGNDNYNAASSATQALTVNKANQTITFGALATKLTTDAAFALNATASSGSTVTFTSSNTGVATVLGNTVTIVGAGTTAITASAAASGNYNAASDVTQNLTVNSPPTTLAVGDIAILGFNSNAPDGFAFVTWVDLKPNTVIKFTDNAFLSSASATSSGNGRGGENFVTWTNNTGGVIPAGTVITIIDGTPTTTSQGSISQTLSGLSGSGDQIFAYQGVGAGTSTSNSDFGTNVNPSTFTGTILFGLNFGSNWLATGTASSNTSYRPNELDATFGSIALVTSSTTRGQYTGPRTGLTLAQLRTAVVDPANWTTATSTGVITLNATAFTIAQSQMITFGSLTSKTYGDSTFDLTASASSGLTVSYASANTAVATVSGSTVTIVGAGTTTITASQTGNSSYSAAASVPQTLTVNKADQTITELAATDSKVYGDADYTLAVTKGASTSALSFASSDAGVATIDASGLVRVVGAGTTTFTVNQAADANYSAAPAVTQTLTVAKIGQTITFGSLPAVTYAGGATLNLTATAASGLEVSYASSNPAVATVFGNTVNIVGAGTTVITANQVGDNNYNAAPAVTRTLTVNKADHAITFSSLPAVTYSVGATLNLTATASSGLEVSYASSNPAVATVFGNTVTIVGAGTTVITASQAGNTNYNPATSADQTLTVNPASQADVSGTLALATITFGNTTTVTASGGTGTGAYEFRQNGGTGSVSFTGTGVSRTITPTAVGTAVIEVRRVADTNYNDSSWVASGTLTVNPAAPTSLSYANINGTVGTAITNVNPTVTGTVDSYSISPALPAGLLLNTGTGVISGTPSAAAVSDTYTVTATNAGGSTSTALTIVLGYAVGPVAVADSLTKPAGNAAYLIPVSQLLANDYRITNSSGATATSGLTVTAVTSGSGNSVVYNVGDLLILFTPSSASTDTITYTVSYGGMTATGTVTITTETQAPEFRLQIVKVGAATFAGGNTTVTHDFIGVPNQTYLLEYTTDMEGAWTSAGDQNTGTTGSFSVNFTTSGDVAADWTARMFFRARLVR